MEGICREEEKYKKQIKPFLERKLQDYTTKIQKLKKRQKIVKVLFINVIVLSIACSLVCATLGAFAVPPVVIPILSTTGALATAISLKFNLEGKKNELNQTICMLDKIKDKIDYVVSCNGDFTEAECKQILHDLV